jgi:hypothetical protein
MRRLKIFGLTMSRLLDVENAGSSRHDWIWDKCFQYYKIAPAILKAGNERLGKYPTNGLSE